MPKAMAPPRRLDHDQIASDYLHRLELSIDARGELHGCTTLTIGRIVRRSGRANTGRSPYRYDQDAVAADYIAGLLTIAEIAEMARKHRCYETTVHDIARTRSLGRHVPH